MTEVPVPTIAHDARVESQETPQLKVPPNSSQKKQKHWLVIILVILLMGLLGVAVFLAYQKYTLRLEVKQEKVAPILTPSSVPTTQLKQEKESELKSVDETWNLYINYRFGFSIKVPKYSYQNDGACEWSEKNGDHSYRCKMEKVPIKVFEEEDGVFISREYFYILEGETKEDRRSFYSDCHKEDNSLYLLKQRRNSWHILVKKAENDQELDSLLKAIFGSSCSLGEKRETQQERLLDIVVKGDGMDLGETKCPLNFRYIVKYSPSKKLVFTWNIGQDVSFWGDIDYKDVYDELMVSSFMSL